MAVRFLARLNWVSRRFYASAAQSSKMTLAEMEAAESKHATSTMKTWKRISLFVAVPAILICTYNAVVKEMEHHTHPRPEFVPYPHLRMRNKAFPWGDGNHSLFHNPHSNALPEGYEGDDEGHGQDDDEGHGH